MLDFTIGPLSVSAAALYNRCIYNIPDTLLTHIHHCCLLVMMLCDINIAEIPVHRSGIAEPASVSLLQNTVPDTLPTVSGDDTRMEAIAAYSAALSEGTVTDSTPGSAVIHHTPSLEEGTILSSISSYRSVADQRPGLCLIITVFPA